jgi:glycerol-3-phosphate cytidylyltransferase
MNLLKIEEIRKQGNRVGYTCSTFDLLHAGHISMLAEAKSKCDFLIAGILSDPTIDRDDKQSPCQSLFERWVQLDAVSYVDMIIPFSSEQDIIDMILTLNPDIRIVGEEYKDVDHTGKGLCPIFYNLRKHSFSSTELKERIKNG